MSDVLDQLQARLGYTFRNPALLKQAVTHSSFLPENPGVQINQRLEFLGDAVLQLLLTEALYQLFPDEREGGLSRRRSTLTKGIFLVRLARELELEKCLLLGTSEESTGGRQRPSALEDAFEALIGAIYLDSDLSQTRSVILKRYGDLSARLGDMESQENPKGRLQELVQPLHGNHALRYEVTSIEGEDHARAFEIEVFLHDRSLGRGRGSSKKLAEESAARAALEVLQAEPIS